MRRDPVVIILMILLLNFRIKNLLID